MIFSFKADTTAPPPSTESRPTFESLYRALGKVESMQTGRCWAQYIANFKGCFLRDFLLKAAIVCWRESHIHSAPSGILKHTLNAEKNDLKMDLMIKLAPYPHKCLWLSSGTEMSCWKLNLVHLCSGGNPVFKINMLVLFEVVCSSKAQLLCLYYAWYSREM